MVKKKSSSTVKLQLTPGSLCGYRVNDPAKDRRGILMRIIDTGFATYTEVMRRLNVLAIFNKNKNPAMTEKIRKDMDFLRRRKK